MEEGPDDYVHGGDGGIDRTQRSFHKMESMEEAHSEFQFGNDVEVEVISDESSDDECDDFDDNEDPISKSFRRSQNAIEHEELHHVFHEERVDHDDGTNLHEQPKSPLTSGSNPFSIFNFATSPKAYGEGYGYSAVTPKQNVQRKSPKKRGSPQNRSTTRALERRTIGDVVSAAWFQTWDGDSSLGGFCLRELKELLIGCSIMLCYLSPVFLLLSTVGVFTGVIYMQNGVLRESGFGVSTSTGKFIGIAFATMVIGFLFTFPASLCFDASKRLLKHRERENIGISGWIVVFVTALVAIGIYVGAASAGIAMVLQAYYTDLDFGATCAFVSLVRTIEGFTLLLLNPLGRWNKKFDEKGFEVRVWRLPFLVELVLLMLGGSAAGVSAYLTAVSSGLFLAIPHGAWLAAGLGCSWQASILPVLMVFAIHEIHFRYQSNFGDVELLSMGIHPAA